MNADEYSKVITLRIPASVAEALKSVTGMGKPSINTYVIDAIREKLAAASQAAA